MDKKKPSWVPDKAWETYLSYYTHHSHFCALAKVDKNYKHYPIHYNQRWEQDRDAFFKKIIFSSEAEKLWRLMPHGKDAGRILIILFTSRIKSDEERNEKQRSTKLRRKMIKNIDVLTRNLNSAGYISGLHQFVHRNGTLKRENGAGEFTDTDILEVIDSLRQFLQSAEIGIYGTAFIPKTMALLASRERREDIDFTRCLYVHLMKIGFEDKLETRKFILTAVELLFDDDGQGQYGDKFLMDAIEKLKTNSSQKKVLSS